jgi:ADP-ribose pyrophosphatase YjhB (NUDIX family)
MIERQIRCAPTAGMLIRDPEGRILLQRRADSGLWGLPGGHLTPGESVAECATREIMEETGWRVKVIGLLGIYSDPEFQTYIYPDGNVVQFVATVFEALAIEQTGTNDDESLCTQFFAQDELPKQLVRTSLPQIADALSTAPRPFIR